MSQGQDWNMPGAASAYQQPPVDQAYQPSSANQAYQAYQQPLGQYGSQPVPNQQQPYQQPYQQGYQQPYQQPFQQGYQQPYQQGYAGQPVTQVIPKNAGIALLISFFIPGVGSLYAGKTNTGVIILIGYIVSWLLTLVIIGYIGVFGFWVWGMIDAYQAAQAWNRARGILS
jgi:TM2 domain-containing membrane protein YozV